MAKAAMLDVFSESNGYDNATNIGGSRYPLWTSQAFNPNNFVGQTTPVPLALLSVPPTYDQLPQNGSGGNGSSAYGSLASMKPWSPSASPTPHIIFWLVVGVLGIHFLYYSKKKRKR